VGPEVVLLTSWDKYEREESDAPWRVPHADRHIPRDVTDVSTSTTRKWLVSNFHLQLKERSGLVGCRSPSTTGCAFHISHISGFHEVLKDNPFRSKPPARAHLPVALPSEYDNPPKDRPEWMLRPLWRVFVDKATLAHFKLVSVDHLSILKILDVLRCFLRLARPDREIYFPAWCLTPCVPPIGMVGSGAHWREILHRFARSIFASCLQRPNPASIGYPPSSMSRSRRWVSAPLTVQRVPPVYKLCAQADDSTTLQATTPTCKMTLIDVSRRVVATEAAATIWFSLLGARDVLGGIWLGVMVMWVLLHAWWGKQTGGKKVTCISSHWQSRSEDGPLPHEIRESYRTRRECVISAHRSIQNLEPRLDTLYMLSSLGFRWTVVHANVVPLHEAFHRCDSNVVLAWATWSSHGLEPVRSQTVYD